MPDWNYHVIGEVPRVGVLAIRSDTRDGEVYLLSYDGQPPWPGLGNSLALAISKVVESNPN